MPAYVLLINWTDQGIRDVKQSTQRLQAARRLVESAGGNIPHAYWTVGSYDLVVIAEAPNDETLSSVLLAIGSQGSVRTTTLRAFNEEEFPRVIQNMPDIS